MLEKLKNKNIMLILCGDAFLIIMAAILFFLCSPQIHLKEGDVTLEAGCEFVASDLIEDYSWRKKVSVTIDNPVDTSVPGEYEVSYKVGFRTWKKQITVVDTMPPELHLIEENAKVSIAKEFDPGMVLESAEDATGIEQLSHRFLSGAIDTLGNAEIEITAADAYGNTVVKTLKVRIADGTPPELSLSTNSIEVELGEKTDYLSYVESVKDNLSKKSEIKLSYQLNSGKLDRTGTAKVDIIAADKEGNEARKTLTVLVVDHKPPTLVMKSGTVSFAVDDKITAWDLVEKAEDADGKPTLTMKVTSGDINEEGVSTVEVTAIDASGNSSTGNIKIYRKPRTFNSMGWDITGIEGQPYLVGVNRTTNVVTVYGKDTSGDYSVPVIAFRCSVGKPGNTTITGRFTTRERYEWHRLVDDTMGRYCIRISGPYLFHSVPYYSAHPDDLEWPEYNKLGTAASLGCIRMRCSDVLWLYKNCPTGFVTIIYDAETDPIATQTFTPIDETDETTRTWDPTDTTPGNPWKE